MRHERNDPITDNKQFRIGQDGHEVPTEAKGKDTYGANKDK